LFIEAAYLVPHASPTHLPTLLPIRCAIIPTGPDWLHEIKHDGYRLIVRRDGDRSACSPGGGGLSAARLR